MSFILNAVPNYTGPYISDGKFQSSKKFGSAVPKDKLDSLSRLHDSAYANWNDRLHKAAADEIYADAAYDLPGLFPSIAAFVVRHVNRVANLGANPDIDSNTFSGALREVNQFYLTDPSIGGGGVKRNKMSFGSKNIGDAKEAVKNAEDNPGVITVNIQPPKSKTINETKTLDEQIAYAPTIDGLQQPTKQVVYFPKLPDKPVDSGLIFGNKIKTTLGIPRVEVNDTPNLPCCYDPKLYYRSSLDWKIKKYKKKKKNRIYIF